MAIFTSNIESRRWRYVVAILVAIFVGLIFGPAFQMFLLRPGVQLVLFLAGMILTAGVIILYGANLQTRKFEVVLWVGLAAVYTMLFFRLGVAERSHLMEYGVLAIFIHHALLARAYLQGRPVTTALLAFGLTIFIGLIDECFQPEFVIITSL